MDAKIAGLDMLRRCALALGVCGLLGSGAGTRALQAVDVVMTAGVRAEISGLDPQDNSEARILRVANRFLEESASKRFRYLRASSFPGGGRQVAAFRTPELSEFLARVERLREAPGCQAEVLGVMENVAVRWVCSDGKGARRVLTGSDPFLVAGGDVLFVRLLPGDDIRNPVFEAYVSSDKPSVAQAVHTVEQWSKVDPTVDWRIAIAAHPWQYLDNRFPSNNPNLLLLPRPTSAPSNATPRVKARFDAATQSFHEWAASQAGSGEREGDIRDK